MAEAELSLIKELKDLGEDLTCPVCHDVFENPKILPCGHYYCKECVQQLAGRGQGASKSFSCPECRKDTILPRNDAGELPTAFFVNRMKDHRSRLEDKMAQRCSAAPVSTAPATCTEHDDPLKLFCFDCDKLICRDCTVFDHAGHRFEFVKTAAPRCSELLRKAREKLQENETSLTEARGRLKQTKAEVQEQSERVTGNVRQSFATLHEILRLREQELLRKVDHLKEEKIWVLSSQEESVEAAISEVKHIEEKVEWLLTTANGEELLEAHKQILLKMERKNQHCLHLSLEPAEKPNIGARVDCADRISSACENHSTVYTCADASKCIVKGVQPTVNIGQSVHATISLKYSDGAPCKERQVVEARVHSTSQGSSTPVAISEIQPGVYGFSYCLNVRGRHQLFVEANGSQILGSPLPIFVAIAPTQLRKPVRVINNVHRPSSLAFTKSELIVVNECGARPKVSIIDKFGRSLLDITGEEIRAPNGLAVDDEGNIYVTDCYHHTLQKYDSSGRLLEVTGGQGSQPGKFRTPGEILIVQNELVLVCEYQGHRIQVFDKSLNFFRSFGSHGNSLGFLNTPGDLACDKAGQNIYVADSANHRIQVFTLQGMSLCAFGGKASRYGNLEHPLNLCLDCTEKFLLVSDIKGHRISVFGTNNGKFITSFGSEGVGPGELLNPTRIAMDKDGYLYVCDSGNNRIQVF